MLFTQKPTDKHTIKCTYFRRQRANKVKKNLVRRVQLNYCDLVTTVALFTTQMRRKGLVAICTKYSYTSHLSESMLSND